MATTASSSHPTANATPTLSSPQLTDSNDIYTTLTLAYNQRPSEAEEGAFDDHIHKLAKLDNPASREAKREWAKKEARATAHAASDAWNEISDDVREIYEKIRLVEGEMQREEVRLRA